MRIVAKGLLLTSLAAGSLYAAETSIPVIHVAAFDLPQSPALSPEAQEYFARPRPPVDGGGGANRTEPKSDEEFIAAQRASLARMEGSYAAPLAERAIDIYPVKITDKEMGGVLVEDFEPADGIAAGNKNRVLISLRGGAFGTLGSRYINRTASAPVSNIGRIRVVSVLHKPTSFKFPSGSEDIAAVYRELLKTYPARNIGIYGCSAGGISATQAVAWIIDKNMPRPGAMAVLGVGMQTAVEKPIGDSVYFSAIAQGKAPPAGILKPESTKIFGPYGYFGAVSHNDRLVNPLVDSAFLAKFPPVMLLTGTRAFDMSPVIATQRALERAGVETSLQLYDGMPHCFYAIPNLPESRDANERIYRFFDRRLGR